MSFLSPIALLSWIPITLILFANFQNHRAAFYSILIGWLFLPQSVIALPGLPDFSKSLAISVSVLFGLIIFDSAKLRELKISKFDIPILIFLLTPIATSLSNGLGLWDGLSSSVGTIMIWGIPYMVGRIYFNELTRASELFHLVIVGGLIYVPFVLFEARMSPKLHDMVYGYTQHSWAQHIRYGGWRPKVFMQHGLMVALWMAITAIAAFWNWRIGLHKKILGLPAFFVFAVLCIATLLCKSGNGLIILVIGCLSYLPFRLMRSTILLILLLLSLPVYMGVRSTATWDGVEALEILSMVVDDERTGSVRARMKQEDHFSEKALERPFLGWGGWKRSFPYNDKGRQMTRGVDALWVIIFGKNGYIGLAGLVLTVMTGSWLILRSYKTRRESLSGNDYDFVIALAVIPVLFMLDCLYNAMISPVYILISGSLVALYLSESVTNNDLLENDS